MGLYSELLAERSGSRGDRVAARRSPSSRSAFSREPSKPASTNVQTLLFSRAAGWTPAEAKKWAKSHGYKHGKTHVTDQYIRIRQFDPKGFKVKKTITLGRGIRAVVAREEDMAAKRRRRTAKKTAPKRRRTHRTREVVAAPKRRRRARRVASPTIVAASRPKRRRAKRRVVRAWKGAKAAHARAARKGWARKRRSSAKRSAPKRRRRRMSEATVVAAPRRRRSRRRRHAAVSAPRRRSHRRRARRHVTYEMNAPRRHSRRRHSRRMHASRSGGGMGMGEMATAVAMSGLGFLAADGLDRFLATYNPAKTKPTDKFTSDGAGTLANTLNVASRPGLVRAGAAVAATLVPAVGAHYTKGMTRAAFEGMAIGAGINALKLLVTNVIVPLFKPKDAVSLQKSFIARLYPAEVSAAINMAAAQTAVPTGTAFGALSGQPGVVGDVGPFALATAGDSQFPDAASALRRQAGMADQFPSLQNQWGTGANAWQGMPGVGQFPTAAQAMHGRGLVGAANDHPQPIATDVTSYQPGPPPLPGPGPQAAPHESCGCIGGIGSQYIGMLADKPEEDVFPTRMS